MIDKKEMTAPVASVGADAEQSSQICTVDSIPENSEDFNNPEEYFRKMQQGMALQMDPSYLKTVTMTELYDNVFEGEADLIEGLLYREAYLFVGSPKVWMAFL